jgi:tetratricopeptide (TPR) repeat protein
MGQEYVNVVSYYNTYYNAKIAFDGAEQEINDAEENGLDSLELGGSSQIPQTAKAKLDTAIIKASKLLTFYPTSKYVDDALFMIGKSYFYEGDYLKADRKFLELFAKFPHSEFILSAQFWYGRSLFRQKKYDEGVQRLQDLYTTATGKGGDKNIAGEVLVELGKYYFHVKDYDNAVKNLTQGIALSGDDELRARAQLKIGSCYEQSGDFQKALQAYDKVDDFGPGYNTLFRSKFDAARMLEKLNRYNEALSKFEGFLDEAKNKDHFAEINYQIADVYLQLGRWSDAIAKYQYIDTTFARTDEAANSYFKLGTLYETRFNDYSKAEIEYDKARSEFATSVVTLPAAQKSNDFQRYFKLRDNLFLYDSLRTRIEKQRAEVDSAIHAQDSSRIAEISSAPQARDSSQKDSLQRFVAHADSIQKVDSTLIARETVNLVSDKAAMDSLQRLLVKTKFALGDLFYLDLNQPDSAIFWFKVVINESSDSELTARSLFTLADIYNTSGDTLVVDSLYHLTIAADPHSAYAQEARKTLGLPLLKKEVDPAGLLYANAEEDIDSAKTDSAIKILRGIVHEYSMSPFCAKALYAIGWLYENTLHQEDSASSVYRRLIAQYPSSVFAMAVKPEIQLEDEAIKEAEEKARKEEEAKKSREEEEKKAKEEKNVKPGEGTKQESSAPSEKKPALTEPLKKVQEQDSSKFRSP